MDGKRSRAKRLTEEFDAFTVKLGRTADCALAPLIGGQFLCGVVLHFRMPARSIVDQTNL